MSTSTKQQFEGTTIEEALASAVSTLGDDLEILDAQRVMHRRPLRVRRKERFEVTAAKRARVEPKGFDDVLRRMVDRVDDAERLVGADLADTDETWWPSADFVLPDDERRASYAAARHSARAPELEVDVRLEPARATRARPQTVTEEARQLFDEAPVVVVSEPQPVAAPAVIAVDDPRWSKDALLALDLPSALVGRIRGELVDDLDWVSALARAIEELLQMAEHISGPCELTGHGAESAVNLIRGACDGFRLDSLIIEGRRVPATPLELALAIRSLLSGKRS